MIPASFPKLLDSKYELVRLLGKGGMGTVFEARHRATGRRVAVKVIALDRLPSSPGLVERFRREALVSGAIDSQYVAQILDAGVDAASAQPYMALELLVGEDLSRAIGRMGSVPSDVALRIAAQACLGLQRAHEAGVTHRDIKPANLFLSRREGDVIVKVLDFGLAKVKDDLVGLRGAAEAGVLSSADAIVGSPNYMSPEQALGHRTLDQRTDLWSLGVVLYEMLCGRTPTEGLGTLVEIVLCICNRPPSPLEEVSQGISPEIAAIVHRALAREPQDRFPSAAAMYEAICALLPEGHALEESMFPPLPRPATDDAPGALAGSGSLHDGSTLTPEEDARWRAAFHGPPEGVPSPAKVRAGALTPGSVVVPSRADAKRTLGLWIGIASLALVVGIGSVVVLRARRDTPPPASSALAATATKVEIAALTASEHPLGSMEPAPAPPVVLTSASVPRASSSAQPAPRLAPRARAAASSPVPPPASAAPPGPSPAGKADPLDPFGFGARK